MHSLVDFKICYSSSVMDLLTNQFQINREKTCHTHGAAHSSITVCILTVTGTCTSLQEYESRKENGRREKGRRAQSVINL